MLFKDCVLRKDYLGMCAVMNALVRQFLCAEHSRMVKIRKVQKSNGAHKENYRSMRTSLPTLFRITVGTDQAWSLKF